MGGLPDRDAAMNITFNNVVGDHSFMMKEIGNNVLEYCIDGQQVSQAGFNEVLRLESHKEYLRGRDVGSLLDLLGRLVREPPGSLTRGPP